MLSSGQTACRRLGTSEAEWKEMQKKCVQDEAWGRGRPICPKAFQKDLRLRQARNNRSLEQKGRIKTRGRIKNRGSAANMFSTKYSRAQNLLPQKN
jgi:hypothetical protein